LLNFNTIHAFLSSVLAKLSDIENSPVFWPTLYKRTVYITEQLLVNMNAVP